MDSTESNALKMDFLSSDALKTRTSMEKISMIVDKVKDGNITLIIRRSVDQDVQETFGLSPDQSWSVTNAIISDALPLIIDTDPVSSKSLTVFVR